MDREADDDFRTRCRAVLEMAAADAPEWVPHSALDGLVRHAELVRNANQTMNLTRITEPEEMAALHVLDSLAGHGAARASEDRHVVDVGTGAGFPGIPLALTMPNARITLLDGTRKKIDFLAGAVADLELADRVSARWGRLEERGVLEGLDADVLAFRAVGAIEKIAGWIPRTFGGEVWLWKGPSASDELESARPALQRAALRVRERLPYGLPAPAGDREHEIIVLESE